MGLFGRNKNENEINWVVLETEQQLHEFIDKSSETPVMLFKHSTRCSISSMAKSRLERSWNYTSDQIIPVYLDLIAFREISNKIAELTGVVHQSPQAIVLKNKEVIYHASHNSIDISGIV